LKLRHFGRGGPDAESALDRKYPLPPGMAETKVEVNVKQGGAGEDASPAPPTGAVQKNFTKRSVGPR
jgi:hypothetical protein